MPLLIFLYILISCDKEEIEGKLITINGNSWKNPNDHAEQMQIDDNICL